MKIAQKLIKKYPPSKPCSCNICLEYCRRPGWWTVDEATRAMDAGYAGRMMLEMSPDRTYGVLSPAFKGCGGGVALNEFASNGCNFLTNNLCELFGTEFQPLECRYCHHDRKGLGPKCHADIELDWKSAKGMALIAKWGDLTGFWKRLD